MLFRLLLIYPSAGPISLATTFGVSVDFLSYRYLDVSVPCVRSFYTMYSCESTTRVVGSPIRISADQCLFTTPRSFSQCITSFFASDCQGIHQMPLLRLILLRINNLPDYLYFSVKSTRSYLFIKKVYYTFSIRSYSNSSLLFTLLYNYPPSGGGKEVRTPDPLLAKQVLSQLSYTPNNWWVWEDLNFRPHAYQACALTT